MRTIYNELHSLHHGKVEMFRGELGALDVPVRDLDLAVQVEAVGEARVQVLRDHLAGLLGQRDHARIHRLTS